ncbi:hypothetical protein III_03337 [Bacillus mycoides]|uniref:DUF3952 domain-containing protein n=1 Tax=Bacillus mycoides TaxID=1405 RepID=A0ABC9R3S3_BACMY|nr:hypothetical protein III_03337 [Bacillus mycoides]
MKLKKKAKMMIVLSIVSSLLSGCGFGETKIEYERVVKALDEGDMNTLMSTSDEGYA